MNPIHENRIRQARPAQVRSGLSIIEVLTSVVVAMIGVFGVMILIPFAVKQAQTGLDSDAAVQVGRNAYSQFEITGYRSPENWAIFRGPATGMTSYSPFKDRDDNNDGIPNTDNNGDPLGPDPPQVFSIDPIGFNENGGANLLQQNLNTIFPYNRLDIGTPYPPNLLIAPANLGTPTGVMMNLPVARRMFRSSDDLVIGEATDELLGPEQYFDQGGTGVLRRQSLGWLSWSTIVVPFKDDLLLANTDRWSYKMYILVYKDRNTFIEPVLAERDPNDQMATAQVTNTGSANPVSTVFLETGATPITVQGVVSRDDWVMLINRNRTSEPGFDRQIAFYRVVNVANESTSSPANLTLDGPPFVFNDGSGNFGPTYVVHLQNVVGVYERTFVPESESTWNVSF